IGIGEKDWYDVGGGESGWIAARQDDPDIVFAGSYGGLITRYDHRTGQERAINAWPDNPMGWGAANLKYRFQWTFPIVVAPLNPNDLFIAAQVLFRSSNEGQSWQAISPDLTRNDKSKQGLSGGPITKDNTSIEYYNTIFTVAPSRSEEHTSELQSLRHLVCRLLLEKKKTFHNSLYVELQMVSFVSLYLFFSPFFFLDYFL